MANSFIPTVSIIIPVYNAERYLSKCIESVINQTFEDWELLLIDDGSQDHSACLCDQYADKDIRIKVFHQQNEGVSSARNLGLLHAVGKWIMFIDSDDWIEKDTISYCLSHSESNEIIRFGVNLIKNDNSVTKDKRGIDSISKEEYFSKIISRQTILGVCGGLYLRSLFDKYQILFDIRYSMGEDWLVLFNLVKHVSKVKFINQYFYNYNLTNEESAVHTLNITKISQLIIITKQICLDKEVDPIKYRKEICTCKSNVCSLCIANLLLSGTDVKILYNIIEEMVRREVYPSIFEIINSVLPIKFKMLLFLVSPLAYFQNIVTKKC